MKLTELKWWSSWDIRTYMDIDFFKPWTPYIQTQGQMW